MLVHPGARLAEARRHLPKAAFRRVGIAVDRLAEDQIVIVGVRGLVEARQVGAGAAVENGALPTHRFRQRERRLRVHLGDVFQADHPRCEPIRIYREPPAVGLGEDDDGENPIRVD